MSHKLVQSQLEVLKLLAKPDSKYRKLILAKADRNLVQAICESIHNVLVGNIPVSDSDKQNLKRFRKTLHALLKKSSLASKKKILIQKGGFLEFLIPAVVSGIASIISSAIGSSSS